MLPAGVIGVVAGFAAEGALAAGSLAGTEGVDAGVDGVLVLPGVLDAPDAGELADAPVPVAPSLPPPPPPHAASITLAASAVHNEVCRAGRSRRAIETTVIRRTMNELNEIISVMRIFERVDPVWNVRFIAERETTCPEGHRGR